MIDGQHPTLREFLDERHMAMMMANNERHLAVMRSFEEIKDKQDLTNGRVTKAERDIAILQWGYGLASVIGGGILVWWLK